jgi:hypothetical protein
LATAVTVAETTVVEESAVPVTLALWAIAI